MRSEGDERRAWVIDDIGGRSHFEDAHSLVLDFQGNPAKVFGGVFDGHGGEEVAKLASSRFPVVLRRFLDDGLPERQALESTFLEIDREATGMAAGSVAVVFLLNGREVTHANAGDSEMLLVSRSNHRILTELHRLSNDKERMRIVEAGGHIDGSYVMIPTGHGLQCTRSLGDDDFRNFGVIPSPHVGNVRLDSQDLWLVAACDGLWDVMLPEEVAAIARKMNTARAVAEALHQEAVVARQTWDNLTVMVVAAGFQDLADSHASSANH